MSFVLIVKNPCCSSSKSRLIHNHLKHIPNIRKFWPRRNNYLNPTKPISIIIARLEKEDRCLDQINGGEGSLANAMAKELFGDENQFSAGYILFTRIFISKKASFFFYICRIIHYFPKTLVSVLVCSNFYAVFCNLIRYDMMRNFLIFFILFKSKTIKRNNIQ